MASILTGVNLSYAGTSAVTNTIYMPQVGWFGTGGYGQYPAPGLTDPLGQNPPPIPHIETEKEWLRRRISEVMWRAA